MQTCSLPISLVDPRLHCRAGGIAAFVTGHVEGSPLSDLHKRIGNEMIVRQHQILGRGAFADTTGSVVVRTVARAEPAIEITRLTDRNTSQMRAVGDHTKPLLVTGLGALLVGLGVLELSERYRFRLFFRRLRAMPHESRH